MNESALRVAETQELYEAAEIDRIQHVHRKFSFWTKDALDRTVARSTKPVAGRANETAPLEDGPEDVVTRFDAPVIDFPAIFNRKTVGEVSVNTMQEWECVVDEVADGVVYSRSRALVGPASSEEYMAIPLREFSPEDQVLLVQGAVFRLIIGFAKKPNGSNIRQAITYIRRYLPKDRRGLDEMIHFLSKERDARLPGA